MHSGGNLASSQNIDQDVVITDQWILVKLIITYVQIRESLVILYT